MSGAEIESRCKMIMARKEFVIYHDLEEDKYWLVPTGQEENAMELLWLGTMRWPRDEQPPIPFPEMDEERIIHGYLWAEDERIDEYAWFTWL